IDQPGHAVSPKAGPPLPRGADGDAELLSHNAGLFTRVQAVDEFSSTKRRQSRILVDVHPGLLSRESDCLAAINFPQVGLGEQPSDSSQLAWMSGGQRCRAAAPPDAPPPVTLGGHVH